MELGPQPPFRPTSPMHRSACAALLLSLGCGSRTPLTYSTFDGDMPSPLDGSASATCGAGANEMVVDAHDGYPGFNGVESVTDHSAPWSVSMIPGVLTVLAGPGDNSAIIVNSRTPIQAGMTYSTQDTQVLLFVDMHGCSHADGSVTVEDLAGTTMGAKTTVSSLVLSFSLTCAEGGALSGCLNYRD
jgi:hypothetical protein